MLVGLEVNRRDEGRNQVCLNFVLENSVDGAVHQGSLEKTDLGHGGVWDMLNLSKTSKGTC